MASPDTQDTIDSRRLRDQWLDRLSVLVGSVESWAEELGWSTRRIEKQMHEPQLGSYRGPALLLQKETTRALLEPIARAAPGVDGVVDLYRMPAYDDVASLSYHDGSWELHYLRPGAAEGSVVQESAGERLSKDTLRRVLEEMQRNGA